jgi:hypothetical protein
MHYASHYEYSYASLSGVMMVDIAQYKSLGILERLQAINVEYKGKVGA